jgi:hypothetical protein
MRPHIGYTLDSAKLQNLRGTAIPQQETVILRILDRILSEKLAPSRT